jgi:serine/threonine protein kinase/tetratricopeptide (TPR) repeat protein
VALKILPAEVAENADRLSRFVKEARTASALKHSNIVPIFEVGDAKGVHFIAMEYVEGKTLEATIAGHPCPASQILDFGIQIADALDEAHSKGIVHRDIKSSNIMITQRGQVKLLDFGLAKMTSIPQSGEVMAAETRTVTEQGIVLGTVQYMSPEQALGKTVDQRSDIFSAGIVLYQMATGVLPFSGNAKSEIIDRIVNAQPESIARFNYELPQDLERIIRRCLEKDPARRYQSAQDLMIDLKNMKRDIESSGHTQTIASPGKTHAFKILVAALLILAAAAAYYSMSHRQSIHSIAVLPFVNATGDPQTEYLSDGITENTINILSQLPDLRVMARSTVFRFKGNQQDPQKVGSDLKVDAVLTGTMNQQQDLLVVNTELVKVADGSQIWGQRFSRKSSDLVAMQTEISNQIAEQLNIRLNGEQRKQLNKQATASAEAYRLYLQGRYQWNKRSRDGFLKAIDFFNQAIELDPAFALAYSGLADCYVAESSPFPLDVRIARAKAAALKAAQLDPSLGEPQISLAGVYLLEWDWDSAEKAFQRGIALCPNYPTGHQWYAEFLNQCGKTTEAIKEAKHALDLDPLSLIITSIVGYSYYFNRDYPRAEEYARRAFALDPQFSAAQEGLFSALTRQNKFEEFFKIIESANLDEENVRFFERLKNAYQAGGPHGIYEEVLQYQISTGQDSYILAFTYARLGEKEKALEYLEKSVRNHESSAPFLNIEPVYDGIRNEPRFQKLVEILNLPK